MRNRNRVARLALLCVLSLTGVSRGDSVIYNGGLTLYPQLQTIGGDQYVLVTEGSTTGPVVQRTDWARPVWTDQTAPESCGTVTPCAWTNTLQAPTISITARADGYDLTATYYNPSGFPRSLGTLSVSGLAFHNGSGVDRGQINMRNFNRVGESMVFPASPLGGCDQHRHFYNAQSYSGERYAPAAVFGPEYAANNQYYVGVSLCYDSMTYRHGVQVWEGSPAPETFETVSNPCGSGTPRVWEVMFGLNPNNNDFSANGELQPLETRTYVIKVRFLKVASGQHTNFWLRTLLPYREYLRDTSVEGHGPVGYDRDPRPVLARYVAGFGDGNCVTGNDASYNDPATYPFPNFSCAAKFPGGVCVYGGLNDNGWTGFTDYMSHETTHCGWERFMLYYPSGRICGDTVGNNIPFRMTSRWFDSGNPSGTLIQGTLTTLASSFPTNGDRSLGFWWGHSSTVQTNGWGDSMSIYDFEPSIPALVALAKDELDGADLVNVREVGLDDMRLPFWKMRDWILEMQGGYNMRFIVEPRSCDIIHRMTPMFQSWASRPTLPEEYHILADFLNPGHEMWTIVPEDETNTNPADFSAHLQALAQKGWVPMMIDHDPVGCASGDVGTLYESIDTASRDSTVNSSGNSPDGAVPPNFRACIHTDCPADFNCDGSVNSADFYDFVAHHGNGDGAADFDMNGVVNSSDFYDFYAAWTTGCP